MATQMSEPPDGDMDDERWRDGSAGALAGSGSRQSRRDRKFSISESAIGAAGGRKMSASNDGQQSSGWLPSRPSIIKSTFDSSNTEVEDIQASMKKGLLLNWTTNALDRDLASRRQCPIYFTIPFRRYGRGGVSGSRQRHGRRA